MWKRLIVGVDESSAAGAAAALAVRLAEALGGDCTPVHALGDLKLAFVEEELLDRVADALRPWIPDEAARHLVVRPGRAAAVLQEAARELGAEAIVLGGKHHSTLGRWMGGSTAHDVVHHLDRPLLITAREPSAQPFRRILAAVDVSAAAPGTAVVARRLARALGAELGGVSVIEPPLPLPDMTDVLTPADFARRAQRVLTRRVWPRLGKGARTTIVQAGPVLAAIRQAASQWEADLVVIGSHGKGLGERLLQGSVTERLLNDLPTSLLVVPPGAGALRSRGPSTVRRPAAAHRSAG
jgi:nucleotide-binding universal stress UspA family protein